MKQSYPKKFLFTQLSALIVGAAGLFCLLSLTKQYFPALLDLKSGSLFFKIAVLIALIVFGLVGSLYVWGRILTSLGVLTKEEAKGYPYSKPWEK
jgi:hypothetical protein